MQGPTADILLRFVAIAASGVVILGCGANHGEAPDSVPSIAVSIPPQAWLVRQIAGDEARVLTLVGGNEDHHTYQPTDAQVSQAMRADVYFRLGVPFERGPWFDALQSVTSLKIVDLREGIELLPMAAHDHHDEAVEEHKHEHAHGDDHDHGAPTDSESQGRDPHIWLTPRLLKAQARTIARTLTELHPEHGTQFKQTFVALEKRLDEVDHSIRRTLAPLRGKPFFVFHPAWGYFAREYGMEQVAVEVEGKEPSDAELTAMQERAKRAGVRAIFVQPQIAGQSARAIAEALQIRLETLDPLNADATEAMLQAAEAIARSFGEREGP
jgi:zinc transport system substrate-binding protein